MKKKEKKHFAFILVERKNRFSLDFKRIEKSRNNTRVLYDN